MMLERTTDAAVSPSAASYVRRMSARSSLHPHRSSAVDLASLVARRLHLPLSIPGDCWGAFQGKGVPLYQVQLDHQAQRAITFQLRDSINDFLRAAHAVDDAMPGSTHELERQLGVRLVVADRTDPEEVGFVGLAEDPAPCFFVSPLLSYCVQVLSRNLSSGVAPST